MKYLDLKTVVSAYSGCYNKTKNQFWGLLAILKAINCHVSPVSSYKFNGAEVSRFLESLFCPNVNVGDYKTDYYYVIFSTEWLERLPSLMLKDVPNIWDVCAWYFQNRSFDDQTTQDDLIDAFFKEIHLTKEETASWFNFERKPIGFYSALFFQSELLDELKQIGVVYPQDGSLSFDKKMGLTSKAGQLTAANFVQSLYSALSIEECLILSKFDFGTLYNTKSTPQNITSTTNDHLQNIFFGSPGTGKSHKIKDNENVKEADKKNLVFRTTFHPDSDYSTFVGAYKPTMRSVADKYKAVVGKEEEITYSFIPQAFLQAYVAAWNNPAEKVFLVIEEINRGNCAQIFGDLFQLLDRDDDGLSEYPIMADKDLAKYLDGKDEEGHPILTNKDGIKDGKLCLPSNLYIWATMNTSDQSLFPIDSAFKRRWDWKYLPIEDAGKKWKIKVNGNEYDWYQFLEAINKEVFTLTHSEDKQLGYFFAKANNDGFIDAEKLVNKVYFYLWTDVFKDYDYESQKAFRKPNSNDPIAFKNFFEDLKDGEKVNEGMAEQVLINLELERQNKPQNLFE